MRIQLIIVFLSFSFLAKPSDCSCPMPPKLSKEACSYYNIIALATVESVELCEGGNQNIQIAIDELYAGRTNRATAIITDCSIHCPIQIASGETWIFFLDKNNAQELVLEKCTHSRKQLPENIQDYDDEVFGMTFTEMKTFLRNNYDVNSHFQNELKPRSYQKVSGTQAIIFVSIGLVAMLLGYIFFIRRPPKNP